jgi:VIT1/CCC1 family predicted Fe2+/Mn2+ transporter
VLSAFAALFASFANSAIFSVLAPVTILISFKDAFKSCAYTGIAYLITVVLLIAPYLLLSNYMVALGCMIGIVLLIITVFTYYTSVAQGQPFKSRFLEMAIISVTVAVVSFGVGVLAKQLFGVDI